MVTKTKPKTTIEWIQESLTDLARNPGTIDIPKLANEIHHEVTMEANRTAHEGISNIFDLLEYPTSA